MTTVFIAGSRHISRLPPEVQSRLDTIIEKGLAVVIGDASGADRAVQSYLAHKRYSSVTVYCMLNDLRHNVGDWQTFPIAARRGASGFEYYATKDRAMAEAASHGLMLWDGKSRGTLSNVLNLTRLQKPVVLYLAPTMRFGTIHSETDLVEFLASCRNPQVEKLERELGIGAELHDRPLFGA
jgi:adenine-specific DNA-methyltransferase